MLSLRARIPGFACMLAFMPNLVFVWCVRQVFHDACNGLPVCRLSLVLLALLALPVVLLQCSGSK
jgi:hypothetical protein